MFLSVAWPLPFAWIPIVTRLPVFETFACEVFEKRRFSAVKLLATPVQGGFCELENESRLKIAPVIVELILEAHGLTPRRQTFRELIWIVEVTLYVPCGKSTHGGKLYLEVSRAAVMALEIAVVSS